MATKPPRQASGPTRRARQQQQRDRKAKADAARPNAAQRGYDAKWRKYRAAYLLEHPLCVMCEAAGRLTAATVVDHITPHRGDAQLMWDSANHQSCCVSCHSGAKQRQDRAAARRSGSAR